MSSMQYYPEDSIAYAIMSAGRFCICNRVCWTHLHMQLCPLPCKTALGRRNTFAIFVNKLSACHEWHGKCSAVGRVFAAIIIREYSCSVIIRRFMACTLAYARTYMYSHVHIHRTVLHSPGHNSICKSVRSGQYCTADTIASDTGRFTRGSLYPWSTPANGHTLGNSHPCSGPNFIALLSTQIWLAWHFSLIKTGLPTKCPRDVHGKQTTAEYQ